MMHVKHACKNLSWPKSGNFFRINNSESNWYLSDMGVDIPEGAMDQAKPFMDMIDAMGQQMFNEIIDENGDGAASIEEIEMVSD